jgi:glycosyltransferase involved in cell wall biosynthesis
MKVLHVVEATTAGVGRHVSDLCTYMRRAGLEVAVACPRAREGAHRDTAFVDRVKAAGVPVAIVPMRRGVRPWVDWRDYVLLVGLVRHHRYDVVHAHSSKAGVVGRLSAWRAGVPAVVYTPNAFAFLGASNRLLDWLYLNGERWLGQWVTDALICVSESERKVAGERRIAPLDRLVLIGNAIEASSFEPVIDRSVAKSALGLDADRPVVGYIGRLAKQKGIGCLIEAARQVIAVEEKTQFVLVGEGELDRVVRQMVSKHGLADHVKLAGYRMDIPQVLAALDLLVLPSLYEGLPYTLLEAMAAGRAVIATDVGGNRDLVRHGETGILVSPNNSAELADALIHLLTAPDERDRLGEAALAAARARPTPEEMTRQVIELYHRLLA